MPTMTLRHTGKLVRNLEESQKIYEKLGFKQLEPVEHLRVVKLADINGRMIELVEGNWHDHIAVNFYKDPDDNTIETVEHLGGCKCTTLRKSE